MPPTRVLFIGENAADSQAFKQQIEKNEVPFSCEVSSALPKADILSALQNFDIIFLDLSGIGRLPPQVPAALQTQQVPLILVAAVKDIDAIVDGMQQGASGYLVKDPGGNHLKLLPITLQKALESVQAQVQLQQVEEARTLLRTVIDSLFNRIFIKDRQGRYLLVNQEMANFSGMTVEEMIGQRDVDFVFHSQLAAESQRQDAVVLETQQAVFIPEELSLNCQGLETWFQWHKLPIQLPNPPQDAVLGIGTNITHHRQMVETLRASEQRLSLALAAARAGVWQWDIASEQWFWSDENFRLLGYKPGDCEPSYARWLATVHPEDRDWAETCVQRVLSASRRSALTSRRPDLELECRFVLPDGSRRWLRNVGQVTWNEQGQVSGLIGIQVDITERKGAEEQVVFQASLLNQVRHAVIATDLNRQITYWNRHAEMLYQWTSMEAIGANVMELIVPTDADAYGQETLQQIMVEGAWEGEFEVYRKDGSVLPIHVVDALIQDREGIPRGYVGVSNDISDRKRSEAEHNQIAAENARQAERLTGQRQVLELLALDAPLSEVLDLVVQILEHQTVGMVGSILLLEGDQLRHGAAPSLPLAYVQAIDGIRIGPKVGSCGTAAFRQEPIVVIDIATDPLWQDYRDLALTYGLRACWSVPIFSKSGEILGTFAQYHQTPYMPTAEDWASINTAVYLAGLAIERKQAEACLRESEQRYASLAAAVPVGIFRTNAAGDCTYVNQRWLEISGLAVETSWGEGWQQAIHPEDREPLQVAWERFVHGNGPFQLEYRFQRPDGVVTWVYGQAVAERDAEGRLVGAVGTITDICDRKQAEIELRQQREFLRTVIDINPNKIFVKDRDGRYLLANRAIAESYGTTVEAIVGQYERDIYPDPAAAAQFLQENRAVIDRQQPLLIPEEKSFPLGDRDQWFQWYKHPITLPGEMIPAVLGIGVNITGHKEAEAILYQYERVVAATTDGIALLDRDYIYRLVNPVCLKWYGKSQAEIIGHSIREMLDETTFETLVRPRLERCLSGEVQQYEAWFDYQTEGPRFVRITYSPYIDLDGSIAGIVFSTHDLTAIKQAEEALHNLVEGTAAVIGADFFPALVSHIAEALQVSHVLVTEQVEESLQTLAFWTEGSLQSTLSFSLANTPCEQTLQNGRFYCACLQQCFPEQLDLLAMGADSYLGLALYNTQGQVIGSLCIFDSKPIDNPAQAEDLLRVFAARAAAELERQRALQALEQLNQALEQRVAERTLALQTSEARYRQIVESQTDFILRSTPEAVITFINPALSVALGRPSAEIIGVPWSEFVPPEYLTDLYKKIATLSPEEPTCENINPDYRANGQIGWTHWINLGIFDRQGNLIEVQSVGRDITQLHQAEEALRQSETRFRNAFDNTTVGMCLVSPTGKYLRANAALCNFLGYPEAELLQLTFQELTHPDDLVHNLELLQPILAGETTSCHIEKRYLTKQGQLVWGLLSTSLVRDPQQNPLYFVTQVQDITDRKWAEKQLRDLSERLDLALQSAQIGIWEWDLVNAQLRWDERMCTLYGVRPEAFGGQYAEWVQRVHPEDRAEQYLTQQKALAGERTCHSEFRVIRPDGAIRFISSSALIQRDQEGEARRVIGLNIDITKRKQTEQENLQLKERLEFVLSASPAVIFTCQPEGDFGTTFISDNICAVTGYTPAEFLAKTSFWADHIHPDDKAQVFAGLPNLFKQGHHIHEYRFRHRADHYLWVRDELRLVRDVQGNPLEIVGYLADISDRKQAELALQQLNEELELRVQQRTQDVLQQAYLLQTILNSMGDGVLVATLTGEIILHNPAAIQLTQVGLPPVSDPSTWQAFWGLYLPDQTPCPVDQIPLVRSIRGESFNQVEILLRNENCPQGRYMEMTGRPLRDGQGQLIGGVVVFRDISERKQVEAQLLHNSLHDILTDLPNRTFLAQRLELALQRAQRCQHPTFAVLFLDLDHFKVINDSLGHLAGDQVLMLVAQKLRSLVRTLDVAARLGGDEFVLLLEDITALQEPVQIAERLFAELQKPLTIDGRDVFVNTSIGIVLSSPTHQSASDLLRDADIALYRAKAQGRGRYAIFNEEMHIQAIQRLQLEQDLRTAIDQGELVVYYQPIIHLKTLKLAGFEALVRWQHPTRGFISPGSFIPIAEETGLITLLDRWVLRTACRQLAVWHHRYPVQADLKMSTNLSVKDLLRPDLLAEIDEVLTETGLEGHHLTLEITESMLIENIQAMVIVLDQLKARGVRVSIDDFGTGYSSLSYLHRLPADAFKIDRSFVMQMEARGKNADIVKTIIALSNRLGLHAIAEGIETEHQLRQLQRLGCEQGQGYWFAKPLPVEAAEAFLEARL